MSNKVWNLKYALGNTDRLEADASNPQTRKQAIEGAETITRNGWRAWVEHHVTGERIFENSKEQEHQRIEAQNTSRDSMDTSRSRQRTQ